MGPNLSDYSKIIYKAKYEIEIECSKNITQNKRYTQYLPSIKIAMISSVKDFDPDEQEHSDLYDHIEAHLPNEIEETFELMHALDSLVMMMDSADAKSITREEVIKIIAQFRKKSLRRRLSTTKGRQPDRLKNNYLNEKNKFESECITVLKKIKQEDRKLNKTALAKDLFNGRLYGNLLRELNKKLKLYEIDYDELVKKIDQ